MKILQTIFMINSAAFFIPGLILVVFLLWILWPKKGGIALFSRLNKNNNRVLMEDALKFIFDCEYNKIDCTVGRIADHLKIRDEKTGHLVNRLASMELIIQDNQRITLTEVGRSYALRIVRVHRIWERYLADETGVSQLDWHIEADRIEHEVTEEETEQLAIRLGNPAFDPHGDPIPTAEGIIPEQKGKVLTNMQKGDMGRIIHLEDEPKSIYEQLVVLGLYPGMQIYVTEVTDSKISFVANGEECVLTPLFAGHVTVEKIQDEVIQTPGNELLSSLKMGEQADVTGISPNCRGLQRRRLMDLGIVPGSRISAVMKSASGDPVGYRVMGTTIGIRKQHADQVFIKR